MAQIDAHGIIWVYHKIELVALKVFKQLYSIKKIVGWETLVFYLSISTPFQKVITGYTRILLIDNEIHLTE